MTRKGKKAKNGTLEKPNEPKANRLTVPGYEPSAKNAGVLPWKWAADRLKKSRQYWIATTRPDGSPHLMVIWGVWLGGSFWFSTGVQVAQGTQSGGEPHA